mmetsp:Transcript_34754/g.78756  ORF Transcript_34754/g.78756 Transcript_34754/m.78756 type:complete len:275 (+) Transcript_34754:949-1773(+)
MFGCKYGGRGGIARSASVSSTSRQKAIRAVLGNFRVHASGGGSPRSSRTSRLRAAQFLSAARVPSDDESSHTRTRCSANGWPRESMCALKVCADSATLRAHATKRTCAFTNGPSDERREDHAGQAGHEEGKPCKACEQRTGTQSLSRPPPSRRVKSRNLPVSVRQKDSARDNEGCAMKPEAGLHTPSVTRTRSCSAADVDVSGNRQESSGQWVLLPRLNHHRTTMSTATTTMAARPNDAPLYTRPPSARTSSSGCRGTCSAACRSPKRSLGRQQ